MSLVVEYQPGGGLSCTQVWAIRRGDAEAPDPFIQDAVLSGKLYGD